MPNWNPQQLKAIEAKNKNVLVSASAGSGKTTVLIARLMNLVMKDHIDINNICAMTFTEAAANEMKKRLAASLQDAYKNSDDEQEKEFITKQLTSIQTAHISTFHSFCLSIIKDYYYILGLRKKRINNILDGASTSKFQQQAMKEAFAKQYTQQDPVFLELCTMFSARSESNEALTQAIVSLAILASGKADSEAFLDEVLVPYESGKRIEDLPELIQFYFYDYLRVQANRYQQYLEELNDYYVNIYCDQEKKANAAFMKKEAAKSLEQYAIDHDYYMYRQEFINVCRSISPPTPDSEDKGYKALRETINKLEDEMLAMLYSEDNYMVGIAKQAPYIKKLVEICRDYRKNYARIKEEQDGIDFDDMEHFALEILQANNGQIADKYREQFVEIMVDEFQDSNDVQDTLVRLICRDKNVFRVGDIKQSIYGFRHAKPDLMKGLIENKGENDEVIYLSNNYRSKKMIVDFNNDLFKYLMNMNGFSCSYAKEDDVEVGVPAQYEDNVPIQFHILDQHHLKEQVSKNTSKDDLKASYIANQIITMRKEQKRSWKDFVVLVRSNAKKEVLKKAFDDCNIPCFIDVKSGFYQSSSVQVVLATMKALLHPHNDLDFVACMMSPLFAKSSDDFINLKLNKEKTDSYYNAANTQKWEELEVFEKLQKCAYNNSLIDLMNAIYDCNDYYAKHTSIQEKTNLDLLFEKALAFTKNEGGSVSSFLKYIDQIKDEQTAEAIPIGSEEDVVRVMSIHQSKGLQFPVVFLWSMDKQANVEAKELCIMDDTLGLAMKRIELPQRLIKKSLLRVAMEHKKNKEEIEEEMRVLYVATTRAQQEMHIVDCIQDIDKYNKALSESDVYNRGGYTSWILQVFYALKSALFEIKIVQLLWEKAVNDETFHSCESIRAYSKIHEDIELTTPSSTHNKKHKTIVLTKPNKGTTYGSAMHKMIECCMGKNYDEQAFYDVAKRIGFMMSEHDYKRLKHLEQDGLFANLLQQEHYFEFPFSVQQYDKKAKKQVLIHGYIDFIAMNEQEIMIVDFKTDSLEADEQFKEAYKEQLNGYKVAMSCVYQNHQISTYIYSLHNERMIKIS